MTTKNSVAADRLADRTMSQTSSAMTEDDPFVRYYERQSLTAVSEKRFREIRNKVLRFHVRAATDTLNIVDIGCGPGELSFLLAESGHNVTGLDINEPLIAIARRRARERDSGVQFHVGTAEKLPFPDASQDICVVPELMEHVADWAACLDEMTRILRPGGVLFLSTTNVLCPKQREFTLPLYSWYPGWLKRRCVAKALTTHPEWVNHAEYPGINWFSFYRLRRALAARGYRSLDRFDTAAPGGGFVQRGVQTAIRVCPPLRFVGHVLTPYTQVVAIRHG